MQNLNLNKRNRQLNVQRSNKFKFFKNLFLFSSILIILLIGCYTAFCSKAIPLATDETSTLANLATPYEETYMSTMKNDYEKQLDSLQNELITEVETYIKSKNPNTKLSASNIVNLCIEYDFDIPLLLSQAQVETAFGKTSKKSNSVFGVYNKKFEHPDHSVLNYIQLMKKSYVRTRTPEQCIAAGFYVEGSKKYKYASNPKYSQTIKMVRSTIIRTTSIQDIHKQIRELQEKISSLKSLSDEHSDDILLTAV